VFLRDQRRGKDKLRGNPSSITSTNTRLSEEQTMSRGSSRKVDNLASYTEIDEIPKQAAEEKVNKRSPNKKASRTNNEEQVDIVTESVTSEVHIKQSDRVGTIDLAVGAVTVVSVEKSPKKRKSIEVDANESDLKKPMPTDSVESPKRAKTKRKAEIDEKETEAMPFAARTPIQSLKRAIYIGAHVSGAGGKCFHITRQQVASRASTVCTFKLGLYRVLL
jgi:hypothetical protein